MLKKYLYIFTILAVNFSLFSNANAYEEIEKNPTDELYKCSPSIEIDVEKFYPGSAKIVRSNNLKRRSGSGFFAKGKKIYVKGRVFDDNCVPVSNATVQIWQADANGVFRNDVSNPKDEDPHFAGSGEIRTNNLGRFAFITVLPGQTEDAPFPYVNIMAFKHGLGQIQTRMYLVDKFEVAKRKKLYKEKTKIEEEDKEQIATTEEEASKEEETDEAPLPMGEEEAAEEEMAEENSNTPPDAVEVFSEVDLFDKHKSLIAKKTMSRDNSGKKINTFIFNLTLPGEQKFKMY